MPYTLYLVCESRMLQFYLLHMDHLAAGIQCAVNANLLAFKLLNLVLVINIVGCSRRGILQYVLIALFHDCARECLHAGRIGRLCL